MPNIPEIPLDACTEENMGLLHNGYVTSVVTGSVQTRTHTQQPPPANTKMQAFPKLNLIPLDHVVNIVRSHTRRFALNY